MREGRFHRLAAGGQARLLQLGQHPCHGIVDVAGAVGDLQMLHQRLRVVDIRLNAVGHQHAIDVVSAIGRHRHGRHGGAVLAAGDTAAAAGHLLAHPLQHPGKLELYVESAHVIPPVNG
mgnify:CR=1 FL=1